MSHSRRASGSWLGSSLDGSSPKQSSLPFAATFLVTPDEAHKLHGIAAKLKLASPPTPSESASQTPISTPATPVTSVPPRISALSSAIASGPDESTSDALGASWKQDAALPLTIRTATRAFLLGYAVNSALEALLPALLRKKTPREALRTLASKTSARVGGALGLYALLYRTLVQLLSLVRSRALLKLPKEPESLETHRARLFARLVRLSRSASLVPFLAAIGSTPALILLPAQGTSSFPTQDVVVDLLSKSAAAAYAESRRCNSRVTRWVPNWADSALLYAVGNGQLLYAFLFEPDCFPEGYGNLIMSRSTAYVPPRPSALPESIAWPTKREIADHIALLSTPSKTKTAFPSFSSPLLSALTPSSHPTTDYLKINPVLDYSPAHPAHKNLLCALTHPREPSCSKNYISFWKREWIASAKFVAAVMAALNVLGYKKVIKDPETAVFKFMMAVVQGATVISGSIGAAWGLICLFQHYLPRNLLPRSRYFLNGFLSSIFIYAVPASRRQQLGMYVGRMSVKSQWAVLKKHGRVTPVRNGEALLLSAALTVLLVMYEARPAALSGGMKGFLGRVVGPRQGGVLGLRHEDQPAALAANKKELDGTLSEKDVGTSTSIGQDESKDAGEGTKRRARFAS